MIKLVISTGQENEEQVSVAIHIEAEEDAEYSEMIATYAFGRVIKALAGDGLSILNDDLAKDISKEVKYLEYLHSDGVDIIEFIKAIRPKED